MRTDSDGSESAVGESEGSVGLKDKSQESPKCKEKPTKKDKKLVFLSRSVLLCDRKHPMTTGTVIANEILELYRRFSDKVDFKNVQRRVYDALNVLSAMEIISKYKN